MTDDSRPETSEAPSETIERGTYEIIRDRLVGHGRLLAERAEALNARRLELFGGIETAVIGSERIRTEHNCVPRDIVAVGARILFGYNVFIGLRRETTVADVLSLHEIVTTPEGFAFPAIEAASPDNFLTFPKFVDDFTELYKYYKLTRLLQLRRVDDKLLAVFQIGEQRTDLKVFRWAVDPNGRATYIDNRGERDHVFPASHDFEWTPTRREDHVAGRHPHVNILNEVFVETTAGDLTIKVENNTESGEGIFREAVDDPSQSLDDAEVYYARVGTLILLQVLPYRETTRRYLVFNTRTHEAKRIDAIGTACVSLPDDHGIIFPGGYYLQGGETKTFEGDVGGMEFMRKIRSPNGEDVLYVFHRRNDGLSILLPYNLIRKEVQNPLYCHGYSRFDDGRLVIFRAVSDEPVRVHPMQIWRTPFMTAEHAASAPSTGSFLENIGNADLVRGVSEALSIRRLVDQQQPTRQKYEDLIAAATRMADSFHWLGNQETVGDLLTPLHEVRATAELIIDEFEKVEALRAQAASAVTGAQAELDTLFRSLRPDSWQAVDEFTSALAQLRSRRGQLITLRELRYVDRLRLDAMEAEIVERFDKLSARAVTFMTGDDALVPYHQKLAEVEGRIAGITRVTEAVPLTERLEEFGDGLDVLTDIVGGLQIDDTTVRTRILEGVSEVMGGLNRARAMVAGRRKDLLHKEGVAAFGVEFNLFSQSVTGAIGLADSPDKCERQLSRIMLALEGLETRFSEFDEFLEQLASKREEVFEAFSSKKQVLVDGQQRRSQNLQSAAERILQGVTRRAQTLESADAQNAFFAADPMVAKLRELGDKLRELGDGVRADEIDSKLKSSREDAARGLRDRKEMFEEGANVIRLGRHRFSVNTQPLELTMVPRDGRLVFFLTGTDFHQPIDDVEFEATSHLWEQQLVSDTTDVYRGEYLASCILEEAELARDGASLDKLHAAARAEGGLLALARVYAESRYDHGYERGVHDHDAALILDRLLALHSTADLLRFGSIPRAFAALFWASLGEPDLRAVWERQARNLRRLREAFAHSIAITEFAAEISRRIAAFCAAHAMPITDADARTAGLYLFEELARQPQQFVLSADADGLRRDFVAHLELTDRYREFSDDIGSLRADIARRYQIAHAWVASFLGQAPPERRAAIGHALEETVVALLVDDVLSRSVATARVTVELEGLLGQHRRIAQGRMTLRLDEFLGRLSRFRHDAVPAFRKFQELRHRLLQRERAALRLDEFKPRVMSSFVRNRLINDVYLPVIGDNLAKQMGALGADKRTDLMGMLLLISPPGYGKTTLMEYVANRFGLVFMKINGPALGHAVTSLDPTEAPNATARQEIEKLNLALEMGNNVLLYVDDIQHTNPEFLQKFISLCDAQRKIEGVWKGVTRTYDFRGKRFAVCMAGNPYTESGERFQIPDMLANRADIYNLGDILEGKDEVFALSYIENALTSNGVLAPLTTRPPDDVVKLVRMARGEEVQADQLAHGYSAVELGEILAVLKKCLAIQAVVLSVNQQYIASASQQEAYRTEPPFKLQGSYRNMNKMAAKVVAAMNDLELRALISDHYVGEAQTLTSGAEENLLKLKELRGILAGADAARWAEIKRGFARVQSLGGDEDDPVTRVTSQLGMVSERLHGIGAAITEALSRTGGTAALGPYLTKLDDTLTALRTQKHPEPKHAPTVNEHFMSTQAALIDATLIPLLRSMAHKLKDSKTFKDRKLRALLPKLEYIDTLGDLLAALDQIDEATMAEIAEKADPKGGLPPVAKPSGT